MTTTHPEVTNSARRLLDVRDLADQIGISVPTIYRLRSLGEDLPKAIRIGASVRWRQETVDEWLANREAV